MRFIALLPQKKIYKLKYFELMLMLFPLSSLIKLLQSSSIKVTRSAQLFSVACGDNQVEKEDLCEFYELCSCSPSVL